MKNFSGNMKMAPSRRPEVSPFREGISNPGAQSILQSFIRDGGLKISYSPVQARQSEVPPINRQTPLSKMENQKVKFGQSSPRVNTQISHGESLYEDGHEGEFYGGGYRVDRERSSSPFEKKTPLYGEPYDRESQLIKSPRNLRSPGRGFYASQGSPERLRQSGSPANMQYRSQYEKRFTGEELKILKMKFANQNRDNKIGSLGFLSILNLSELKDTLIGQRLFNAIRSLSNSSPRSINSIDYEKYIKGVAILARGDIEERCLLIYGMFDQNRKGYISRAEMVDILFDFLKNFRGAIFDNQNINILRSKISEIGEDELESIIQDIVGDIYYSFSQDGNTLDYRQWRDWFLGQSGINEVLNYRLKRLF